MKIIQFINVECAGMSASITLQPFRSGFHATLATHPWSEQYRVFRKTAKDALTTVLLTSINFFEGIDPQTGGDADEVWLTQPSRFVDLATVEKFYEGTRTLVNVRTV